jgi:hypothetical protein
MVVPKRWQRIDIFSDYLLVPSEEHLALDIKSQ